MRRLRLDTRTLIWHYEDKPALSREAGLAIECPDNRIVVSAASLWEMTIKVNLGKLILDASVSEVLAWYRDAGVDILPITDTHALAVGALPKAHRDPFDRILVAQAITENLELVTRDPIFKEYPVRRLW